MVLASVSAEQHQPGRLRCAIFCGPGTGAIAALSSAIYQSSAAQIQIEIVTPARLVDEVKKLASFDLAIVRDEDLPGYARVHSFLESRRNQLSSRGRSIGWYLQQYLKLAHAWHASSRMFVHDGDTVFSPALLHRLSTEPFLMVTREQVDTYNRAAIKVKLPIHRQSFIANGGLFDPAVLASLGASAQDWFINTMERGVLDNSETADFSEYQIMGALLAKSLPIRPIRMFRRFDLITIAPDHPTTRSRTDLALLRYDAVAFESGHRSSWVKRTAGRLAYCARYTW